VGIAEWPAASSFDDAPVTRYVFHVPAVPDRMLPLLSSTPGLGVYVPAAPGAAVEVGVRHPGNLRACPVFNEAGLVRFGGRGLEPLELPKPPALGDVSAFARVELKKGALTARVDSSARDPNAISLAIALRLVPTSEPWRSVTASWIRREELPILR